VARGGLSPSVLIGHLAVLRAVGMVIVRCEQVLVALRVVGMVIVRCEQVLVARHEIGMAIDRCEQVLVAHHGETAQEVFTVRVLCVLHLERVTLARLGLECPEVFPKPERLCPLVTSLRCVRPASQIGARSRAKLRNKAGLGQF